MMSEDFVKEANCYLYIGELLVETGVLQDLERFLCYPGTIIFHTTSSTEARAIVENNNIVAIVIDQYLPFCSGLELMRWLHSFAYIPAIIVGKRSEQDGDTEAVVALEAGASDAVNASISARELAARVKACTRKYLHATSEPNAGPYPPDTSITRRTAKVPLYFAPEWRRLYFSDATRAVLHVKEAELMTLLIAKHPAFIDREEISQNIFRVPWNPNDRRIDNLISKLRKIIDTTPSDNTDSIIETVRNEGYRLRSPIALIPGGSNISYARSDVGSHPPGVRD